MPGMARLKVLIVEDHPIVREGLEMMIASQEDMEVVGMAANYDEGLACYQRLRPDLTLTDLRLPGRNGIELLTAIRSLRANAQVVVISTSEGDGDIQRALQAGASGYTLKSMSRHEILGTLRAVRTKGRHVAPIIAAKLAEHFGEDGLTDREVEVLRLVREGMRNREIATVLRIAETTVNFHIKNMLDKLQANDRTHAVTIAIRRGLLPLS